ncbi:MAG TPA: hypothetical protein VN039_05710 [Nitrospira sp.]|nr:hypothetical protein [Nitrospira sp.]
MSFFTRSEKLEVVINKLKDAQRVLKEAADEAESADAHGVARRIDSHIVRLRTCEGHTRSAIGRLQRRASAKGEA